MLRVIMLCLLLAPAAYGYVSLNPYLPMVPSVYGDARCGAQFDTVATNLMASLRIPTGSYTGITVCAWLRCQGVTNNLYLTTAAIWTPEAVSLYNPDLTYGVFGWGANTNLAGALTITNFPFASYVGIPAKVSNTWPRAVYTIAWSNSATTTCTLGGTDYTLAAGAGTNNFIPGPAASVVLSGTGTVSVGISRTPCAELFCQIDGVAGEGQGLTTDCTVSNEIIFAVWRISLNESGHNYQANLMPITGTTNVSVSESLALPRSVRAMSSDGAYSFGLQGLGGGKVGRTLEWFDARLFLRWISDAEIQRVYQNGVEEITRRGIPRWR